MGEKSRVGPGTFFTWEETTIPGKSLVKQGKERGFRLWVRSQTGAMGEIRPSKAGFEAVQT